MNKTKVIDLLNMISKGEEVPNKIRINGTLYWFDDRQKQYIYVPNEEIAGCDDIYSNTLILTYEPFDVLDEFLNTEVEIIEENKKIEKIPLTYADDRKPEEVYEYIRCSINQIIDILNKE